MMETYTTQLTHQNHLWLQALREKALKEAREKEMTRTQRPEGEKIRQGAWQQLFFQGYGRFSLIRRHSSEESQS